MKETIKILHLEDLPADAELVDRVLRKSSLVYEKKVVDNRMQFVGMLENFHPDIILSDHSLPSFDSQEALAIVREMQLRIPFILITATVSEEYAVSIMKEGADDYILKDRLQRLPNAIVSAIEKFDLEKRAQEEKEQQAILKQKLITETSIRAQEREREEIGKELHDNINQILASAKMYFEASAIEKEAFEDLVHKGISRLSMAIDEIRKLSHRLVAPSLENISLVEAIRQFIDNNREVAPVKISFEATNFSEERLNGDAKLMLYRIVQEQFSNIVKHAQAKNAVVELHADNDVVKLHIHDDGKGFEQIKKIPGIGLRNISNRAKLYNGSVSLSSAPGKGCSLDVTVPLA